MGFFLLLFITMFYPTVEDQWVSVLNPITFSQNTIEHVLNDGGYAILSAGRNPATWTDLQLNDKTIQKRSEQLVDDIKDTYVYSPVIGVYDGGIETSFFILLHNDSPDDELEDLIQLGKKYNQDSIIYVRKDKPTIEQLIYTSGHYQGRHVEGTGYQKLPFNVTDNYSKVKLCSNMTFTFTLNFNFKYMFIDKLRIRTNQLIDHHNRNHEANKERCRN
ncbi:unnamed protein product [Adineta steineri]|uniref:Uncharacterized protein n=1 Tax=Adineta steineri TaxID=433720 RepID=A0A818VN36_9BILA|nr:unnamed protein product [Adineta steineri]CAF3711641.1 unnamed protein product [Adineta steineri]